MRAVESAKPAGERICFDPLARRLVPTWFYWAIKLLAGYGERRTHGALTFIVCRCRYIDDFLGQRLKEGTRQAVILGAGLDSRAYREPLLSSQAITFEVDHPATQRNKITRVKEVLGKVPADVVYVALDFTLENLDELLKKGFNPLAQTLFISEGVAPYLPEDAVDSMLAWIRYHASPRSALIIDFQHTPPSRRDHAYTLISHASGEGRAFGIPRGKVDAFFTRRGFAHVVTAGAEQLQALYCTGPNQGRTVSSNYTIVTAEVPPSDSEAPQRN